MLDRLEAKALAELDLALRSGLDLLLIAATALERGLTVVTRNLRHFTPTGVATLNPWIDALKTRSAQHRQRSISRLYPSAHQRTAP